MGSAQQTHMWCQWNERTCQAKLPVAAFQGLLNSNCSYVERIVTRSFVKVGYTNTEWNFLISPVMLCSHCVSFELDKLLLVCLGQWNAGKLWLITDFLLICFTGINIPRSFSSMINAYISVKMWNAPLQWKNYWLFQSERNYLLLFNNDTKHDFFGNYQS